jgi:hypothetical protein
MEHVRLSSHEAAKASLLLIRDKDNNPVKLVDGKVPEGSFVCVDGMMGGKLQGNFPLVPTPSFWNLKNEDWSLQFLNHETAAWFSKSGDGYWVSIDLTTKENWKDGHHHQLLDFVLCWLNHPDQMIIECIDDPEERSAAKSARQRAIDKKRFGM